jgi:hypothetical protein
MPRRNRIDPEDCLGRRRGPLADFDRCEIARDLARQWENVDFERGIIFLEDSKTGPKPLFLSAPALAILDQLARKAENPYVVPGVGKGEPKADLKRIWKAVTEHAGLTVCGSRICGIIPATRLFRQLVGDGC